MTRKIALHFEDSVDSVHAQNLAEEVRRAIQATGTKVALDAASVAIGVARLEFAESRHLPDIRRIVELAAEKLDLRGEVSVADE